MCPTLDEPKFMAQFDVTMTFERTSDIWVPYFGPATVPDLTRPVSPKIAPSPVVYLQANPNDRCGRMAYAADLMKMVRVDSFGLVHRNQTTSIAPGWRRRQELYRNYKLTLAFENSFAPDYVTEKFFEPLIAGSVPVYRGTEDIRELAPAPDCYIDACNFASGRELGRYLNHLESHDDEYLAYHEWRTRGFSAQFEKHIANLQTDPFCRLAEFVSASVQAI